MPAVTATAPGKIILFGEHAVVYGRPALAAPVSQVQARAVVVAGPRFPGGDVRVLAPDIDLDSRVADLAEDHPLRRIIQEVLDELGLKQAPACTVRLTSTIPLAAGLGSGAALSVALIRAFAGFLGRPLPTARVSALAFEVEKIYHGAPSGIDNTVIAYARPVYFVRGQPIEVLNVITPFTIVIGDTGVRSPTSAAVGDVRRMWQAAPAPYEELFDRIGQIALLARQAIEGGQPWRLGPLMDENHALLRQMGVSSPELNQLVEAARQAGALGAKLSGAGRGGNMIALAAPGDSERETAESIAAALQSAGAVRTLITVVSPVKPSQPENKNGKDSG